MESTRTYDIVVIGAGLCGIAFGRFYLDVHPTTKIVIVDEDNYPGGVWSKSRSYEGFWSQSPLPLAGFSDVPLRIPEDAPTYFDTFEAKHITKYVDDYVDNHVYDGSSLRDRLLLGRYVKSVDKTTDKVWNVTIQAEDRVPIVISAIRLVVATGSTSIPAMPDLPDQPVFQGTIMHQKQFASQSRSILNHPQFEKITVLGAGKSAVDMVYQCAKHGKTVNWIIRKSGEGPALFTIAKGRGKYVSSIETASTRYNASLAPSAFAKRTCWMKLVHRTSFGIRRSRQRILEREERCRSIPLYENRKGALPSFQNLKPTTSAFWCTGPIALTQHEDFWETIAPNVHIHRNDIRNMASHAIVLDDGSRIDTDLLLCGTGWKLEYPFLGPEQVRQLGIPHDPKDDTKEESEVWVDLLERADKRVLRDFPILQDPPSYKAPLKPTTTARLVNCIAPLSDISIVFLGHARLADMFRTAESQAIWATAYFDGNTKTLSEKAAKKQIAYMNALSRRRYPSQGTAGDFFFFDSIFYSDKLLSDVGLRSHRKGWLKDWTTPCLATDLKGIKDEYIQKFGHKRPERNDTKI